MNDFSGFHFIKDQDDKKWGSTEKGTAKFSYSRKLDWNLLYLFIKVYYYKIYYYKIYYYKIYYYKISVAFFFLWIT